MRKSLQNRLAELTARQEERAQAGAASSSSSAPYAAASSSPSQSSASIAALASSAPSSSAPPTFVFTPTPTAQPPRSRVLRIGASGQALPPEPEAAVVAAPEVPIGPAPMVGVWAPPRPFYYFEQHPAPEQKEEDEMDDAEEEYEEGDEEEEEEDEDEEKDMEMGDSGDEEEEESGPSDDSEEQLLTPEELALLEGLEVWRDIHAAELVRLASLPFAAELSFEFYQVVDGGHRGSKTPIIVLSIRPGVYVDRSSVPQYIDRVRIILQRGEPMM